MNTKQHTCPPFKDGEWLPGVTTILNEWSEGYGAISGWQLKQANLGNDPKEVSRFAMLKGTCVHYLVDCHIMGIKPDLDGYPASVIKPAKIGFRGFKKWEKLVKPTYLFTELETVSNQHGYGGTIDIGAIIDGEFGILDVKSGGTYTKHRLQLAAYGESWWEMAVEWFGLASRDSLDYWDIKEKWYPEFHILQLNLNKVGYTFHTLGSLDTEWQIFQRLLEIRNLKKSL